MGSLARRLRHNLVQCQLCGHTIAQGKAQLVGIDLGSWYLFGIVCADCARELGEEEAEDIEELLNASEELLRDGK